jgi:hypothetical protein
MAVLPPGIGNDQQATQATAFIRQQPWYQQWLQSQGIQQGADQQVKLTEPQQQQLMKLAQDNGVGISGDSYHIDENGQIAHNDSHLLRNLAIGGAIAGSMFIPGVAPALMSGLGAVGHGVAAAGSALAGAGGAGSALGGVGTALSTGSKVAGLLGIGADQVNNMGAQDAATANQMANNRITGAKVDQGGPAADKVAMQNAMRAGLVARMDPNASPLSLNGTALPSLTNPENVAYAQTMQKNLAARQAAGKTPTEFGVPDPTQAELDASNAAKTAGTTSNWLTTGSKLVNLFPNLFKGSTDTGGPYYGNTSD